MIMTVWPSAVNDNFFGYKDNPKNNVQKTEFIAGRTIGFQVNTKKSKTIECSLRLKVDTELDAFWDWFNDELGQTAGWFTCPALGDGYYQFTDVPSPANTDRIYRKLTLKIEEVF